MNYCSNCNQSLSRHKCLKWCPTGSGDKYEVRRVSIPTDSQTQTTSIHTNRKAKAEKIIAVINQYAINFGDVPTFNEEQWAMLAEAAAVNIPSVETRKIILERLRDA